MLKCRMPESRNSSLASIIDGFEHPRKTLICLALLIAVSVSQYANIIHNGFVWDSISVFSNDTSTRDLRNIPQFFTQGWALGEDVEGEVSFSKYYRPLVKLMHALEYKAFGEGPMGYKFMSIFLNTLTVVLGFFLVRGIAGSTAIALVASLLYAVSPARAEAVSWSYSDSYLLMSVFVLLALLAYQRGRNMLSAFMFACALLSWEGSILLPAIILAYEALVKRSRDLRSYQKVLPFFALALVYLILRNLIVGQLPVTGVPLPAYINTVFVIIKTALRAALAPEAPVTIYLYRPYTGLTPEVITSYIAAAGLALLALALWKRDRKGLFWLCWFLIWITISFNIGKLSEYLFADKFLVLAALGPSVLLAGSLRLKRRFSVAAAIILSGLFIFHFSSTFQRNSYYKDSITYMEKALEHEPRLKVGLYFLGGEYEKAGNYDAALRNFTALLEYYPNMSNTVKRVTGETYRQKARALINTGDYASALEAYERSFTYLPRESEDYNNMANMLFKMGRNEMAIENWQRSVELDPQNPEPLFNMGTALERTGDYAGAIESYQRFAGTDHPMKQKALDRIRELKTKLR